MIPKLFWILFFVFYNVLEIMLLLFGIGVLPSYWLSILTGFMGGIICFAMMIEGWRKAPPKDTDKRWHSGLAYFGLIYIVPLVLAMAGRIDRRLVILSLIIFIYLAIRLIRLRSWCLSAASQEYADTISK